VYSCVSGVCDCLHSGLVLENWLGGFDLPISQLLAVVRLNESIIVGGLFSAATADPSTQVPFLSLSLYL